MFPLRAIVCLVLLHLVYSENSFDGITVHDDFGLNIYQFLRKYNYPVETHWVQTEDGYVLRMQRISRRNSTFFESEHKPAILLMHGLSCSAMDFVSTGPNRSIALVLADAGYDVWLGNNRGNTWSRNHVVLDPDLDKQSFWNYSYETCGYYDLPAKIDYIIEQTGQPKIFYLGHSQGTTQFFAMGALRPEYNDKIALMIALAPVAYMTHVSSPIIRFLDNYMDALESLFKLLDTHEIMSYSPVNGEMTKILCSGLQEMCATLLFIICGFDSPQLDRDLIPVLSSNTPAGMSVKMLIHYGQGIRTGLFTRYDYGTLLNMKYYNSPTPPAFNTSAITAPVALYYSQNDLLAAVQDVERLANEMPNSKRRLIKYKLFNHLDYIAARDINELVTLNVLKDLEEYVNETIPSTPSYTTRTPTTSNGNIHSFKIATITIALINLWFIYIQ